jgi:hypothetical protein
MDNPAVFLEYAQSDGWTAIHLAQGTSASSSSSSCSAAW